MVVSLDLLANRLRVDLIASQAQLYDGASIVAALGRAPWQRGTVSVDPGRPALIVGLTAATVASVVRFLVDGYGTEVRCHLLDTGVDQEPPLAAELGQLQQLVTGEMDAAVWMEAGDPYRAGRSAETLTRIVARLRAPGGCPWDREQTSRSLRNDIAGEAYEVIDAINHADDRNLAEELGDVLMSVALQAQIAEDEGRFTLADVYEAVNAKLVRRHPHVFGNTAVSGTDDIVANWNRIKAEEKAATGQKAASAADPVSRYPASMPTTAVIDRLLESRKLVHGSGGEASLADPATSAVQDRQALDHFIDWYVTQRSRGADPESDLRDALWRYVALVTSTQRDGSG